MTTPRTVQVLVFVLALGVHQADISLGSPQAAPAVHASAGASRLLAQADRALADLLGAARQLPSDAGPDSVRAAPFWTALRRMSDALTSARTALAAKDPRFFRAIGNGSHALAELDAVWPHLGVSASSVDTGLLALAAPVSALRDRFGYEELRRRQGEALTDAERRRLQRMQEQRRRLVTALETLRQKVAQDRNRELTAELDRLIAESNNIANAALTLETYLYALRRNDLLEGSWDGETPYVDPSHEDDWLAADEVVEEMSVDADTGFVFTVDMGKVGPYLDEEADAVPPAADAAGAGRMEVLEERTPLADRSAAAADPTGDDDSGGFDLGSMAADEEPWPSAKGGLEVEDLAELPAANPSAGAARPAAGPLSTPERKRGVFHLFAGAHHDRAFHLLTGATVSAALAHLSTPASGAAVRVVRSANGAKPKGSAKRKGRGGQ